MDLASLLRSASGQCDVQLMTNKLFKVAGKKKIVLAYFVGVTILSYLGWDAVIKHPDLLDAAKTITKVDRLIPITTLDCDQQESCKFIVDPTQTISTYYYQQNGKLKEYLLLHLHKQGKLPSAFDRDLQGIADLYTPMMQSSIIDSLDEGATNRYLRGILLVGETSSGEQRAFISAYSYPVTDRGVPYYQAIFKMGAKDESVQYLEGHGFRFDEDFDEIGMTMFYFTFILLVFCSLPAIIPAICEDMQRGRSTSLPFTPFPL
ncbi:hypothetical protein [Acaryochloris marina]|nr:hypothetical protein [Acaryochloris marina]BDM82295.1 hypothetical protein AM10699_51590 [Acaryochloris marina MBIC10699]